jgi:hypothetical protein
MYDALLIVASLSILALTIIVLALIVRLTGAWPVAPPVTNVANHGDNVQMNINGASQKTSGAYTSIQFQEDSIARLAHLKELTRTLNVVLSAVKNGNYRGDPLIMLIDIGQEIDEETAKNLFCAQLVREGEYPYRVTESELAEAHRAHQNGNGHRAA